MPPSTWKKIELAICRRFGGSRTGPVGKDGPDCVGTAPFAIQVKHRKVPQWLLDAMTQAVLDSPITCLPTLVLHPKGHSIDDSLVIIKLSDFEEYYLGGQSNNDN